MKRKNLLVSLAVVAVQSISFSAFAEEASVFPSEAKESYDLPAIETRADRLARMGEEPAWGVSKRAVEPHNPYPFGGGPVDD